MGDPALIANIFYAYTTLEWRHSFIISFFIFPVFKSYNKKSWLFDLGFPFIHYTASIFFCFRNKSYNFFIFFESPYEPKLFIDRAFTTLLNLTLLVWQVFYWFNNSFCLALWMWRVFLLVEILLNCLFYKSIYNITIFKY